MRIEDFEYIDTENFVSTMSVKESCFESFCNNDWRESSLMLKSKLKYVLTEELFTDLTCLVGQGEFLEEIKCHSFILRLYSKSFNKNFISVTIPPTYIELPKFLPIDFKRFLLFLYTEKFNSSVEEAIPLLHIATEFEVRPLVEQCSKLLKDQIDIPNSCIIYARATEYGEIELSKFTQNFISRNAADVFRTQGFRELPYECLKSLLESSEKNIDELSAFNGMIRWAKEQCERKNLELIGQNFQLVLKDCIDLINYEAFTATEFSEHVVDTEVLSATVALRILKKLNINQATTGSNMSIPKLTLSRTTSSSSSGISVSSEHSSCSSSNSSSPILEFHEFSTWNQTKQQLREGIFKLVRYKNLTPQAWQPGGIQKLMFMCHKSLKICGVGLFARSSPTSSQFCPINTSLTLSTSEELAQIASVRRLLPYSAEGGISSCLFDVPVTLEPKQWYTLTVDISGDIFPVGTRGKKKQSLRVGPKETVTIEFKNPKVVFGTSTGRSQFPEILFSL